VSRRTRGVVACALGALLLTGCSAGPVEIDSPELSARDEAACRELVADLPDTVAGQQARETSPPDAVVAAWGDPAIVLTCGVDQPSDFTDTSTCVQADGVGWYVPDAVLLSDDESLDVTMTAVGYRPRVQVVLPGDYRPEGFAAAAATLGRIVDRDLEKVARCR
jgi:hypothetical protein